ncbi:MAG: transporter substrate-binding domain-containing protein [Deferribacteres bacterium]|nr:transporter substrate-binding domain-containing protein [candidate division KSB1 bacterium]MCB9501222.1 transporter substrate-binding domain-containing protein [Deferribacteres bacterium]
MRILRIVLFFTMFATIISCDQKQNSSKQEVQVKPNARNKITFDLQKIRERGKLIALTRFNANSYFLHRGEPMGFEYELLEQFAQYLDLPLEIKTPSNWQALFTALENGEGDIVAANLAITKSRAKKYLFADHYSTTRQVLVQRLPDNWQQMKHHEIERSMLRNQIDLIGKKIHVRKTSAYFTRLKNLSEEIGGDIKIIEVSEDLETEDLIRMVSEGDIEFTVADENIALINHTYLPNIDVKTSISLPQRLAWALRIDCKNLQNEINKWLSEIKAKDSQVFNIIYNKYYRNRRSIRNRLKSNYYVRTTGTLSPFDDEFRDAAEKIDWDWRMLAALSYQESEFNPKAKSWAGAVGLMQLMPKTARQFGANKITDPQQNLMAGVHYLAWLENYWKEIPDSTERQKFILASYNTGQGHIQDARRLAKKYGADPNIWDDNVANFILKKSKPKYFNDVVVEFGYCRGQEPFEYVQEILEKYQLYKQFVEEDVSEKG